MTRDTKYGQRIISECPMDRIDFTRRVRSCEGMDEGRSAVTSSRTTEIKRKQWSQTKNDQFERVDFGTLCL